MTGPTKATVTLVFTRDEGCCARCGNPITGERGWGWSVHHRRPRSSGGTSLAWVNLPANLLLLCGSGTTGCHGVIESNRAEAYDFGFLVSANGTKRADEVGVEHSIHGVCYLNDDGGWELVA